MPVVNDVKCTASSVPTPDITQNRKDLKKPHFTITTKTATTEASTKKPIINKKGIFILSPLKHMRQAPGICTKKRICPNTKSSGSKFFYKRKPYALCAKTI